MTLTEDQKAAVQAWVEQLRGGAVDLVRAGRLVDEPPLVKAWVMLAEPNLYYARCRQERLDETRQDVTRQLRRAQDEPDGAP